MSEKKILEIACFNLESVRIAENAGADRIELCEDYFMGGITPAEEMIRQAKKEIQIPIHVIVRPRGGDFFYNANEREQIKKSILFCKEQNIDGVVFGCLTSENKVDLALCKELIAISKPISITFHRAIDECENNVNEIEKLVNMGFDRVLTSGGKKNALEGKEILRELNTKFKNKIIILPGGGIRATNIGTIIKTTNCSEYHSSALIDSSFLCDEREIRNLKKILSSI